jgi:hypothetical protein
LKRLPIAIGKAEPPAEKVSALGNRRERAGVCRIEYDRFLGQPVNVGRSYPVVPVAAEVVTPQGV